MGNEVTATPEVKEPSAVEVASQEPEEDDDLPDISDIEEAKKYIKKLRTEARNRRLKNKDLEEQARKWKEYEDSQKTEFQRLQETAAQLQAALEAEKVERLRKDIVIETGLDPDLAELLVGSEKEMRAIAKRLVAKTSKKTADFYAGHRGRRVTPQVDTFSDFMKQLWNEADQKSSRTT
jgi:hypothetical protein